MIAVRECSTAMSMDHGSAVPPVRFPAWAGASLERKNRINVLFRQWAMTYRRGTGGRRPVPGTQIHWYEARLARLFTFRTEARISGEWFTDESR